MNPNVISVGKITKKQYDKAYMKLLNAGHRPKVVHVSFEELFLVPVDELSDSDDVLIARYGTAKEKAHAKELDWSTGYDELAKMVDRCCARHLKQFTPIGALVMHARYYEEFEENSGALIDELYRRRDFDMWLVQPSGEAVFHG